MAEPTPHVASDVYAEFGPIDEFPGWRNTARMPRFDRDNLVDIDGVLPVDDNFWGPLSSYCVPECCGFGAFDLRADNIRWSMELTDEHPPDVAGITPYRSPDLPDVADLASRFLEAAAVFDDSDEVVVVSKRLNNFFEPRELAALCRYFADILDPQPT